MELLNHQRAEKSTYQLKLKIDGETFKKAVGETYRKSAKKYNIPGFRKGKAPQQIIEKMYGGDVFHYDAINAIFPEQYKEIIKQTGIEPVDSPSVDIESLDINDGVVLTASVAVKPLIEIGKYKGLSIEKIDYTVSESEIDDKINELRKKGARQINIAGPAKKGDIADISFQGFVNDTPFEGGEGVNHRLPLGSGQFIPGFEEQIIGHMPGDEFIVNVDFPEDYHADDLNGEHSMFRVTLNELTTTELPAEDDELAKDVSEFDTIKELRESIKNEIGERKEQQSKADIEDQLVNKVVETITGDIPEVMFEDCARDIITGIKDRLREQGLSMDNYLRYTNNTLENFKNNYKEDAQKQVKTRLVLEKIVSNEGLAATEEDLEKEVLRIAEIYNMDVEKVREIVPLDDIKRDLALNKAIDLLKETAIITTKEINEVKTDE